MNGRRRRSRAAAATRLYAARRRSPPPPVPALPPLRHPCALPCPGPLLPQYLVAGEKWEGLDPLVGSRLLLAPLFMRRRELAGELQPSLARLAAAGASDK